jgi:hypothetical protein
MFRNRHTHLARITALAVALSCVGTGSGYCALDFRNEAEVTGYLESVIEAFKKWFNSHNSGQTSPDGSQATPDSPSPAVTATATPPPTASSQIAGSALAVMIASDSGGHADQYATYAERLSETLARLTPAQRARILGGNRALVAPAAQR